MIAQTETTDPALSLRGVTVGYGRSTVLRSVTVHVQPGEVVALLGPNGAGKTTLLRTAAGELSPRSGLIRLGGVDVTGSRPERRVRAGLCTVPEGRGIFPNLSVRENVLLQVPHSRRVEGVEAALSAFPDLADRLDQRAGSMSGGQQQMLALSRCFSTKPSVVMLDEVSLGLAPRVIDQIFEAISLLASRGTSILLVEQYVKRALSMCDRVYVLDRGAVTYCGSPDDIEESELTERYLHAGRAR